MLARSYTVLRRFEEAIPAYARASELEPNNANLLADYADAVAATQQTANNPKSIALIERALKAHPDHTGLNHYLVHTVDAPGVAQRAVVAADRLGTLAPQSPHLVHMPSHTYIRVARYADATRVNQAALAAQQQLDARLETLHFAQTKNWNGHNRHFLWFAAHLELEPIFQH